MEPLRARAAAAARALIAGRMDFDAFEREFGDVDDPKIAELVSLIASEPEMDGFLGVGPAAYESFRATIERLIAELEQE